MEEIDIIELLKKVKEGKAPKIGSIRKRNIASLNKNELQMRCAYDEQYIAILENKIKELNMKVNQHKKEIQDNADDFENRDRWE